MCPIRKFVDSLSGGTSQSLPLTKFLHVVLLHLGCLTHFTCPSPWRTSLPAKVSRHVLFFPCAPFPHLFLQELRIDDYIRAYNATGRPPLPCPQIPTDSASRTRAGLPPLFEPLSDSKLTGTNSTQSSTRDPSALPAAQEFTATKLEGESFHTLSAMPLYQFFSLEELRMYAYLRGNKVSPTPIVMSPFVIAPVTPTATPFDSTNNSVPVSGEQLLTITTKPEYSGHSLESKYESTEET
ncbi:hypothetical protein C0995_002499 [Termitomyces sp. Mi166|nr:hypothetical protein C0995_002499 [Termitomyces sp. Mi166\